VSSAAKNLLFVRFVQFRAGLSASLRVVVTNLFFFIKTQNEFFVALWLGVKKIVSTYFSSEFPRDLRFSPYPKRGRKKGAKTIKKRAFPIVFPSRSIVFR
jgi:hypothetical protein